MLIYLLIYSFMQLGAFAVIVMLRRADVVGDELKDFSGLHVPPSVRRVRDAAVHAVARRHSADRRLHGQVLAVRRRDRRRLLWLAVIGVLNSAISLYYYIRIVVFMYLKKETIGLGAGDDAGAGVGAGAWPSSATLVLGVYPRLLFELAEASARTLGAAGDRGRAPLSAERGRRQV